MKISIINGSPKSGKSTSELMTEYLLSLLSRSEHEIESCRIRQGNMPEPQLERITNSEVLIFAFPLYIDSIPANLLKLLIELEKRKFTAGNTMVYCVINNGFFEGKQTCIGAEQMKNWCRAANLTWGQALGAGAGEMLPFLKSVPLGHGPNKNIGAAMKQFSKNIQNKQSGEDLFVSPNWPRWMWKIEASLFVWYPRAKANGLKIRELKSRREAAEK